MITSIFSTMKDLQDFCKDYCIAIRIHNESIIFTPDHDITRQEIWTPEISPFRTIACWHCSTRPQDPPKKTDELKDHFFFNGSRVDVTDNAAVKLDFAHFIVILDDYKYRRGMKITNIDRNSFQVHALINNKKITWKCCCNGNNKVIWDVQDIYGGWHVCSLEQACRFIWRYLE